MLLGCGGVTLHLLVVSSRDGRMLTREVKAPSVRVVTVRLVPDPSSSFVSPRMCRKRTRAAGRVVAAALPLHPPVRPSVYTSIHPSNRTTDAVPVRPMTPLPSVHQPTVRHRPARQRPSFMTREGGRCGMKGSRGQLPARRRRITHQGRLGWWLPAALCHRQRRGGNSPAAVGGLR
jgi:hypothetical protein